MTLDNVVFQLPTSDMLEEIISKVPNIPIETGEYYWIGGYYPKHHVFIDSKGNLKDYANDMSRAYCFKVRPVLYFKEDLPGNKGDKMLIINPASDKYRSCIVIDKRRAIVVAPFCPTCHHENWDVWLNSPSFRHKW